MASETKVWSCFKFELELGEITDSFLSLSFLYATLDRKKSPIPPGLRTLILVRVSQINSCSFCVDLNTSVLLQRGVHLEKVMALSSWKESVFFDTQERLVLEYTEAVADSSVPMSDDLRGECMGTMLSKRSLKSRH